MNMTKTKHFLSFSETGKKTIVKSKNSQPWKIFFIILFSILILSSSISTQAVTICNRSGTDSRLARFIIKGSGLLSLDCHRLNQEGCFARLWNWSLIKDGFCEYYTYGSFYETFFAVQLKDKSGNWYSTSYSENKKILDSYDVGWSGLSNRTMCVKNDTYSPILFDRDVTGMWDAVYNEVCQTGYSKVAVNLFTQTDHETKYTVTIPYEAPPMKVAAKPPVVKEQPKKQLSVKPQPKKKKVVKKRKNK